MLALMKKSALSFFHKQILLLRDRDARQKMHVERLLFMILVEDCKRNELTWRFIVSWSASQVNLVFQFSTAWRKILPKKSVLVFCWVVCITAAVRSIRVTSNRIVVVFAHQDNDRRVVVEAFKAHSGRCEEQRRITAISRIL